MMKKSWFTLIEILIVVFVFCVGILGILTLLTQSIGYFDMVNMETRATMLAKEALDITYNHRDANLAQGFPRNYEDWDKDKGEEIFRTPWVKYKVWLAMDANFYQMQRGAALPSLSEIDPEDTEKIKSAFSALFDQFRVELNTGTDILHYAYPPVIDEEVGKGFARWVEFAEVQGLPASYQGLIYKISAHALYQRGSRTGEVVLESFIGLKDSKDLPTLTSSDG